MALGYNENLLPTRATSVGGQLQNLSRQQLLDSDAYAEKYNQRAISVANGSGGVGLMRTGTINQNLPEVQQAITEAADLKADPWGFYRGGAADTLAQSQGTDPSNIYRDKLAAMAGGSFGIDDPSYKFKFEQGQQALERSQASKGLLGSGNAAMELQQYGQGMASTEYAAQFQRMLQGLTGVESQYNSSQSRLMQLAGVNLDPLGSRKVGIGEMGNAVSAQGQNLQAQSQANSLGFEKTQWQDQLNMNADYQQGLKQGMSPAPSLVSQLGGGGESPSYWK